MCTSTSEKRAEYAENLGLALCSSSSEKNVLARRLLFHICDITELSDSIFVQ